MSQHPQRMLSSKAGLMQAPIRAPFTPSEHKFGLRIQQTTTSIHNRGIRTTVVRGLGPRLVAASSSPPAWNPQNTDEPRVLPSPDFSPEEAVAVQLDALAACDDPWPSHGIQTAYTFGFDIGGLDPSMYFGFRKDLYHLDHFMGQFQTYLPELVNLESYRVEGVREVVDGDDTVWVVRVAVIARASREEQLFDFYLRRKKVGTRKGSLMTDMLVRVAVAT